MSNIFFPKLFIKSNISLFLLLILILSIPLSACTSPDISRDKWFSRDKLYHFATAGAVSAATTAVAKHNENSDVKSMIAGVSVTLALGAGKETYDKKVKKTYFSWRDMFWNLLGAVTGSLIITASD